MSRRITEAERGSLTGHGRIKKDAQADLEQQIDKALTGDYIPLMIRYHEHTAIIWRELDGWRYKIITLITRLSPSHAACLYGCGNVYPTPGECEDQTRNHLAQVAFEFDGPTGIGVILNEDARRDHLRHCEWQYRYRAWRDAGEPDHSAHQKAVYGLWPDGVEPVDVKSLPE